MGRDFPPVQTGPGAHPASCTMGNGSFPGVKYGLGVLLTTLPLLVPRSWKSEAIPRPTLWATTGPVTGTLYLFSLRTAGFNFENPNSMHRMYLCVLYRSQNKQRLFPCTKLSGWFIYSGSFAVRIGSLNIIKVNLCL